MRIFSHPTVDFCLRNYLPSLYAELPTSPSVQCLCRPCGDFDLPSFASSRNIATLLFHLLIKLWLDLLSSIMAIKKIELFGQLSICAGLFSIYPSTSYNLLLGHQRPRLKHNQWPILIPYRSCQFLDDSHLNSINID